MTVFEKKQNNGILNDSFKIDILDKEKNGAVININQLCITGIEYDNKDCSIIFIIDEGQKVLGQRIKFKRSAYEIRSCILAGLKKIYEIPSNESIAKISEL